jgi:hypothetical protein
MFSTQILIAFAVVVFVAVAWTTALTIAGAVWRRDQARGAKALHPVTSPSDSDDTRELVLR